MTGLDAYLTTPPDDSAPSGEARLEIERPWPRSDDPAAWIGLEVLVDVEEAVARPFGVLTRGCLVSLSEEERGQAEVQVTESAWADQREHYRRRR